MTDALPAFHSRRTSEFVHRRHREFNELLWARTQAVAAPEVDFEALDRSSLDQWRLHVDKRTQGLRLFSRRVITANVASTAEVLVTGTLECSVAEAAVLLRCPDEESFNASMSSMHGQAFQHGSVVHSFHPAKEAPLDILAPHRCVKAASFARPRWNFFGHDEHWCFLEEFAGESSDGFKLSQRSLRPASLPRMVRPPIELERRRFGMGFRRSNKRVYHLVGLSLGYAVEAIPDRQPAAVRIKLYACSHDDDAGVVERRMLQLARGLLNLPGIVRQHRMSAQVPAAPGRPTTKHTAGQNAPRCVSCSRALHRLLLVKKTRCYLCAHFVCSKCWIRQPLEAINGRGIAAFVCRQCLHSVQNCNYAHLVASSLSGRASSVSTCSRVSLLGGSSTGEMFCRTAQILPDPDDALEPGESVVNHLEELIYSRQDVLESTEDSNARSHVAVAVLQELVAVLDEGVSRVKTYTNVEVSDTTEPEQDVTSALQTLQSQFSREALPLAACTLSNAVTRQYSIDTFGDGNMVCSGPIPPNEATRLDAIAHENYLAARGSHELELLCELATRELSCAVSLVTIVGSALQYVIATTSTVFHDMDIPREHTFCQHLLMGDRPLLVQHPEADVRFCNVRLVTQLGIQFYCGFPIFSRDGLSVVGSLCCMDTCPREVTQSQYSTLLHLTRTASRIMESKSRQARSLQRTHKQKHRKGG